MCLDRFPQSLLMLAFLSFKGGGHEVLVNQDLGLLNVLLLEIMLGDRAYGALAAGLRLLAYSHLILMVLRWLTT